MKTFITLALAALSLCPLQTHAQQNPISATVSAKSDTKVMANGYPYTQVPFTSVNIAHNSFWGARLQAAREVTVPLAFSKCESEHRYKNFDMAAYTLKHPGHAGMQTPEWDVAKFMGFSFDDTDVYKTIEGASYILQTYPDKKLKAYIDSVLNVVAAAQEPDGYLYTARTINPEHPHAWSGKKRWVKEEDLSHELYNLGHMVDAACAHYQATGSHKFLDIARRYADCVCREVGSASGKTTVVPGHQIAEMALARLYTITGEKRYLDEAKYLLDFRGKTSFRNAYSQSHKPILEQDEAVGHAVRAGYMYAGIADVAALTKDSAYIKTVDRIWQNIYGKKVYLTGGVGARHAGESFGNNYELPNMTAYNETCAAISMVYLNERMFLLHSESKYIDCLERTLYNGVISGMSMDGGRFFYPNPLSSDGKFAFNADNNTTRQPWFGCACCPSNLCRFIPSVPGYLYGVKDNNIYVNLFAANTSTIQVGGKNVVLEESTQYPWDGDIQIRVAKLAAKNVNILVRIPGWVLNQVLPSNLYKYSDTAKPAYTVSVNGKKVEADLAANKGYLPVKNIKKGDVVRIHFDMPVRTVVANKNVKDDEGRVAVERGPIVYCAEAADNQNEPVLRAVIGKQPTFSLVDNYNIANTETKCAPAFAVKAITTQAQMLEDGANGVSVKNQKLTLIPYYAWNHRGANQMNVWFVQSLKMLDK
ncbi:MAG: glycoside hydrolase family 127 protein [Prevotella sp.]|uniref:glycoside hydrolase family 127 protein n=1 Tax=Prevotella sp. TaxID=59823 RepID=UPI0025F6E899|nr:glycoside hydrolase family 127 protein [Prevotella sp.]MCI7119283.1 glycoside hydrolase family 127 protein [Prevotella sp.]